jgi:hypothetical protein
MNTTTQTKALRAWHDATADMKREFLAEREGFHLAAIEADRKKRGVKQGMTHLQGEKARNRAKADWLRKAFSIEEHDGVRNPVWDDEEWGPNAKPAAAPKSTKPNKYGGSCPKCDGWVEAEAGNLVKLPTGKWGAEHITCPPKTEKPAAKAAPEGLDISGLVPGYYAVPGGDTRLKLAISHGNAGSKWEGWSFVKDGAEYGNGERYGMQRPNERYRGKVEDALRTILADPKAAMAAYGHLVSRCGACGRPLEDKDSVARGIGPVCAQMF